MASTRVHRINNIASMVAIFAVVIAVPVFDLAMTQRVPEVHAAAGRQLNKELAQERVTCERWEMPAGTEKYTACIADLKEIRVKHDKRSVEYLGNRRDGLTILW
jgi:hypothetical protein